MLDNLPLDELARTVNSLDRASCIDHLEHFREIPLDFDQAYLKQMSLEKLRHVLMAALLTTRIRRTPPPRA